MGVGDMRSYGRDGYGRFEVWEVRVDMREREREGPDWEVTGLTGLSAD